MAKSSVCQRRPTFWGRWTVKSAAISTICSSQKHSRRSARCLLVLMSAMQGPSPLLASLPHSTLKCLSTTATSWSRRKAKRLFKTTWGTRYFKPSSSSPSTTRASTQLTLLSTETELVMLNVTKCLPARSLSSNRQSTCYTPRWQRSLRSQSLLSTNAFLSASLFWTKKANFTTLLRAASLTRGLLRSMRQIRSNSISSWHLPRPRKVASCPLTSTFPRMTLTWQSLNFSTWLMLCVTSISTGQVQSKCLLLASMRTRLQSSLWTSVPTRSNNPTSPPKIPWSSRRRLTSLLSLWITSFTSCDSCLKYWWVVWVH